MFQRKTCFNLSEKEASETKLWRNCARGWACTLLILLPCLIESADLAGEKKKRLSVVYFIKGSLQRALSRDTPCQDSASEDSISARFKRLLPSSVSSPDRTPRPKKGQRRSFEAKKSLRFLENSENELPSEDKNEEMITPQLNKTLVELNLNVDDLLSYQSTQVKVAIVNPSCRVDLQFNDSISAIWSSIIRNNDSTSIRGHNFFSRQSEDRVN